MATARGEQDRQAAGSAADIQHDVRRQFVGEGQVGIQVITVPVEGVVYGRQARMGEDRIGHPPTLYSHARAEPGLIALPGRRLAAQLADEAHASAG
jgi:hypothetical protein